MAEETSVDSTAQKSEPRKFLGIELTFNPTQKAKKVKPLIEVGAIPIANFMPPRVREGKAAEFVRRRLFVASMATISVAFLSYLGSTVVAFSGLVILQNAELRLASVKAEQAKYTQVRDLENSIRFQEAARYVATSTQVDVSDLIRSLTQQLPEGAKYTSIQVSPFEDSDLKNTGLTKEFAVKVAINMDLEDYPSLQRYLNRLPVIPAFYDARLASVAQTETGISASLVLYLNLDLYSRLFEEPLVLGEPVPRASLIHLLEPSQPLKRKPGVAEPQLLLQHRSQLRLQNHHRLQPKPQLLLQLRR